MAQASTVAVSLSVALTRPQLPLQDGPFHQWVFPSGTLWTAFYRVADGYLLRFPELADFHLTRDGASVQGWPVHGVSDATIQHLYLNQVLPLALSRQGKLVLHGSAVEIDGRSAVFIGESGRGKSTLAASFATSGFRFLTDDGLLLEWSEGECLAMPSHPSIRLWEDSQGALIGPQVMAAPPVQFTSKARLLAGREIVFCDQPRPLRRVYFLGDGSQPAPCFERMKPAQALIELVKNSFILDIEEREVLARHFEALMRLATLPIYYRFDYPRRYEDLAAVREAVVRHAREECASM